MPNQPIEKVLNRDLSRVNAKELIDRYCPLLDELVNYGTQLYTRLSQGLAEMTTEAGVPLLIYLHVLEMTDGASVLFRESAVSAAIPTVRAIFESALALEYILAADTSNRANAWLVAYLAEQLEWANMMAGTEKSGQQFHQAMQGDSVGANISLAPYQALAAKHKTLYETELGRADIATARAERDRLLQTNPYPHWYTCFGGPKNLRQLAKELGREAQYLVLYKYFSGVAHGQNLRRFITRKKSADPLTRLIRDVADFEQLATNATSDALRSTRLLSNHHGEAAQFGKWYAAEIKPGYAP